jgi:hypothetical protein
MEPDRKIIPILACPLNKALIASVSIIVLCSRLITAS